MIITPLVLEALAEEFFIFQLTRQTKILEIDDPPTQPWEVLSDQQKENYLKSLPKKIQGGEFKRLTSQAWNIGKRPVAWYFAPRKGTLQLPMGTNAKTGYETVSASRLVGWWFQLNECSWQKNQIGPI